MKKAETLSHEIRTAPCFVIQEWCRAEISLEARTRVGDAVEHRAMVIPPVSDQIHQMEAEMGWKT